MRTAFTGSPAIWNRVAAVLVLALTLVRRLPEGACGRGGRDPKRIGLLGPRAQSRLDRVGGVDSAGHGGGYWIGSFVEEMNGEVKSVLAEQRKIDEG